MERRSEIARIIASEATLMFVAALATLFWRLEYGSVERNGIVWIRHFYYSVPASMLLFVVWFTTTVPIDGLRKRSFFFAVALVASVIWHQVFSVSLYFGCGGSRTAVFVYGEALEWLLSHSMFIVIPATPLVIAALAWAFGLKPNLWFTVGGCLLFGVAFPVSIEILRVSGYPYVPDILQSVRTGIAIPFLVVCLGQPAIGTTVRIARDSPRPADT